MLKVSSMMSIPSPSSGVWEVGGIPIRGYALCIIVGIALAIWIGERRWRARGGLAGTVMDVAVWAVPFGIIGGRLYHVITSPQAYFGAGGDPVGAFKIWQGGLGSGAPSFSVGWVPGSGCVGGVCLCPRLPMPSPLG